MFFDKVYKLLEGIPDQLEKDIEEFGSEYEQTKKRIADVRKEMNERRENRRLLRKDMKGCRPVNQQTNDEP